MPDRLAADVARLRPDVLALQEVDRGLRRSGGVDLTGVAARAMRARWARFLPAMEAPAGEALAGQGLAGLGPVGQGRAGDGPAGAERRPESAPGYGIALLSRYRLLESIEVDLPALPVPLVLPLGRCRPPRPVVVRDEPRVALVAILDAPGGPLTVAGTHLSFIPGWNAVQLRGLRAALQRLPGPQLLVGDLNAARPWAPGWRRLARVATFPARRPGRQLDHVLARGQVGEVLGCAAVRGAVSDHRALVVELSRR